MKHIARFQIDDIIHCGAWVGAGLKKHLDNGGTGDSS